MGVYDRSTLKRINIVSHGEMGKGRFKRTIKELSQFDDKKPEGLESEFDQFDLDNSYPTSPFVDLDFAYKQLLDGHKACKTTLSLT